jgi:TonB family protein
MTSPHALRRAIAVAGLLAAMCGAGDATAQSRPVASPDSNVILHEVTVTIGTVQITVSRLPAKPVHLSVRTDSGTFTLSGDSAILARWADSAAALPEPPPFVEGVQVSFKVWGIKADGDSGAHMRFARVPTSHGAELALAVTNGVWGDVEYLGSDAPTVLTALRGDSIALAGTAHVKFTASRTYARPECRGRDSLGIFSDDAQDSLCSERHVEKQARQKGGSAGPVYPAELQRTGIGGAATLAFVIDTTGRVDLASIRLMSSTDSRFAVACRRALGRMAFLPAQVDGRKVRDFVQLPFTFKIH